MSVLKIAKRCQARHAPSAWSSSRACCCLASWQHARRAASRFLTASCPHIYTYTYGIYMLCLVLKVTITRPAYGCRGRGWKQIVIVLHLHITITITL